MPEAPATEPDRAFPFSDGKGEVALALALHRPAEGHGAPHLDLFVAALAALGGEPDARAARTWRLPERAWNGSTLATGAYDAEEIAAHRAAYLALAAPRALEGGKGTVTPLLSTRGAARVGPDSVEVDAAGLRLALACRGGGLWRLTIAQRSA